MTATRAQPITDHCEKYPFIKLTEQAYICARGKLYMFTGETRICYTQCIFDMARRTFYSDRVFPKNEKFVQQTPV